MFKDCKERFIYVFVFLFFLFSLIENDFKEWLDYLMMASSVHAFMYPYFCQEKRNIGESFKEK